MILLPLSSGTSYGSQEAHKEKASEFWKMHSVGLIPTVYHSGFFFQDTLCKLVLNHIALFVILLQLPAQNFFWKKNKEEEEIICSKWPLLFSQNNPFPCLSPSPIPWYTPVWSIPLESLSRFPIPACRVEVHCEIIIIISYFIGSAFVWANVSRESLDTVPEAGQGSGEWTPKWMTKKWRRQFSGRELPAVI